MDCKEKIEFFRSRGNGKDSESSVELSAEKVKELFDLPSNVTYLAMSSRSPMLKETAQIGCDSVNLKLRPWEIEPNEDVGKYHQTACELFAKLVNVDVSEIALGHSTAFHISQVAMLFRNSGILSKNSTGTPAGVILLKDQMMSNVMAWQEAARCGDARIIVVDDEDSLTDGVLRALDSEDNVKVAALPPLLWTNGRKVDLEVVGAKCREKNVKLVVDATQSLGVAPLDAAKIGACVVVASIHKWLLGPYGTSFAYYHKDLYSMGSSSKFSPGLVHHDCNRKGFDDGGGAKGTGGCFEFLTNTEVPGYEMEYSEGACRFDIGARPNPIMLPMICSGLRQIFAWGGPAAISMELEKRMKVLVDLLRKFFIVDADRSCHMAAVYPLQEYLTDTKYDVTINPENAQNSWSDDACSYLKKLPHPVYVASRGGGLRVGIYLYNDDSDFGHLFQGLVGFQETLGLNSFSLEAMKYTREIFDSK